jgi:hypothetical protein
VTIPAAAPRGERRPRLRRAVRWNVMQWTRVRKIVAFMLLSGVAFVGWQFRPGGPGWYSGNALYGRVVQVQSRLVREDGTPLAGVCVWAMTYETDAAGMERELAWLRPVLERQAAMPEAARPAYDPQDGCLSDADGRFKVRYMQRQCITMRWGDSTPTLSWPEREGLFGLGVERPRGTPWVLAPPPHGAWTQLPRPEHPLNDPSIAWDLGDVVVPDAGE